MAAGLHRINPTVLAGGPLLLTMPGIALSAALPYHACEPKGIYIVSDGFHSDSAKIQRRYSAKTRPRLLDKNKDVTTLDEFLTIIEKNHSSYLGAHAVYASPSCVKAANLAQAKGGAQAEQTYVKSAEESCEPPRAAHMHD